MAKDVPCPHCGKPINPASLLGAMTSDKKKESAKKHSERMKKMWANQRKLDGTPQPKQPNSPPQFSGANANAAAKAVGFIAPKGSFSKDDLKAMIQAGPKPVGPDLSDTPHAPFDFNEPTSGEPHRVTQMGKKLALFYLGSGEPTFSRYLNPGELEKFWELRIQH